MSFEIDLSKLANPPVKSDQEAITSFWGIYRWPFKTYNRYTQLEGLEQTADETRSMATALRFISRARELGLSIDGGLGWLSGPDINQRVVERNEKLAVFGKSKFVPEPRPTQNGGRVDQNAALSLESRTNVYSTFERMLQEAGYRGDNLEPSIRLMLDTEDLADTDQLAPANMNWENFHPVQIENAYANWRRIRRRQPLMGAANVGATANDDVNMTDDDDENLTPDALAQVLPNASALLPKVAKPKEACTFKPNDLTTAQREMLLEMEWAQNAFMQSWVIAIVDNRSTFSQIENLTVARLPRRHLPILRRSDFWDSLPKLKKLSLAVIPDWRDVKKDETTWVQDNRVAPSHSVPIAYQILFEQISPRKSITSLHFEWISGGEYAPGLFARNQHVLAAPVVAQATHMVNRAQSHAVLALPYVEHLSLKNCWISPHILERLLVPLKQFALQSVTFDSVSLTASVPVHAQPNPLTQVGLAQNAANLAGQAFANMVGVNLPHGGPMGPMAAMNMPVGPMPHFNMPIANAPPAPPLPTTGQNETPEWLQTPRIGSWAEIIDKLSPGRTLAVVRYERDENEDEPPTASSSNIKSLKFISCGYVRLPLDFDQTALDGPPTHHPQSATIAKRINDIDSHMMKPSDPYLGVIINHMAQNEVHALDNMWNFEFGWRPDRLELWSDAVLDGIQDPGKLRFSGSVVRPAPLTSTSRS
jgi:hypothetical protein